MHWINADVKHLLHDDEKKTKEKKRNLKKNMGTTLNKVIKKKNQRGPW